MDTTDLIALSACLIMGAGIFYAARFEFLGREPRGQWLSLASGVTVGYVFLGLLPKLVDSEKKLEKSGNAIAPFLEDHALFVAMLGMLIFYGLALARHAAAEREERLAGDAGETTVTGLFWVTVALHTGYMVLIGYLVSEAAHSDLVRMWVLAIMLAVHFVSTDFGLGHAERHTPSRLGRASLVGGLLLGWAIGMAMEIPKEAVAVSSAFLAGAILLNVLNDELPSRHEAHYLPFAAGTIGSSVLLATIG